MSSGSDVAVSVLIPAYNGEAYLAETIDSILAQRWAPTEVIVVDDGSKDNTAAIASGFGDRVRCHSFENAGICAARNRAVQLSRYPYIAFCDQDDLWREDKLAEQMDLHLRHPGLAYSFTNFVHVVDGAWAAKTKFADAPCGVFEPELTAGEDSYISTTPMATAIERFQPIWPSTVLMKREFFDSLGGFDERFGKNPSEDLEFTLRCMRRPPIGVVRRPVVGIRRHASNYSANVEATDRGSCAILEYALEHHGVDAEEAAVLRDEIARRRIDLTYEPFRRGEFDECVSLLTKVPTRMMNAKVRLKLAIAKSPRPVARLLKDVLVRA